MKTAWVIRGLVGICCLAGIASAAISAQPLMCANPYIIDGDTLDCAGVRIRLKGIDAPEMGECRRGRRCVQGNPYAAKNYLIALTRTQVACYPETLDHYGRTIAQCGAGKVNFSCAMIAAGHAVRRYAPISCP